MIGLFLGFMGWFDVLPARTNIVLPLLSSSVPPSSFRPPSPRQVSSAVSIEYHCYFSLNFINIANERGSKERACMSSGCVAWHGVCSVTWPGSGHGRSVGLGCGVTSVTSDTEGSLDTATDTTTSPLPPSPSFLPPLYYHPYLTHYKDTRTH